MVHIWRDNVENLKEDSLSIDDLIYASFVCKCEAVNFAKCHGSSVGAMALSAGQSAYYMSLGTYYQNAAIIRQNEELLKRYDMKNNADAK